MKKTKLNGLICGVGLCLCSSGAGAASVIFTGTEASTGESYSYLGVVYPLPGATLETGWFAIAVADYLTYSYNTAVNGQSATVKVHAPGFSSGLGYRFKYDTQILELSLKAGVQNFQHTPNINTSDPQGNRYKLSPGVYWQQQITPQWTASVRAAYDIGPRSYWSQAKLAFTPHWRWQAGPVLTAAGGVNYRSRKVGGFVQVNLGHGISIAPELGLSFKPDQPLRAYGGLALSALF
ncbi:cellulose biosynthesis protein BcsS [Halothiobacillus sp.]|uniref:cellulose biosynthesis protein BcsS n=1 Tax=Halothiobacillus sp. TaxID=1891311 RepID=UPI00263A17F6|nr:cellulose biosynthesis protein BcsS [Halothiobacillus sp.]